MDIIEKKAEIEIGDEYSKKESEETAHHLQHLIDIAPGAMAVFNVTDIPYKTLYLSDGWSVITGYSAQRQIDVFNSGFFSDAYYDSDLSAKLKFTHSVEHKCNIDITFRTRHKDGHTCWIQLKAKPVVENDKLLYYGNYTDISNYKKTEEIASRSLQSYRALVNTIPGGIALYEVSELNKIHTLYYSDSLCKLTGHTRQERDAATKDYALALTYANDLPLVQGTIKRAVAESRDIDIEFRMVTKTGDPIWVRMNAVFFRDDDGKSFLHAVFSDMSEIHSVEQLFETEREKFERQNELLLSIYNALPCGILWFTQDADPQLKFINELSAIDLGYSCREAFIEVGSYSLMQYVHPDDRAALIKASQSLAVVGDKSGVSLRLIRADGSIVFLVGTVMLSLSLSGNVLVQLLYTNITDVKQKEEVLLHEAQKYEILVNSIPGGVGIYRVDEQFTPIYISDRVCELCGLTREEYFEAIKESAVFVFHPDDIPGLQQKIADVINGGISFDYTYRLRQKDGSFKWTRVWGRLMPHQDNGYPVICTVFLDVDEAKKLEDSLKEIQIRYEVAIKSSGIDILEYDFDSDTLLVFSNTNRIEHGQHIFENYISTTIANGKLREDSISSFKKIFERLRSGEKEVVGDIWYRTNDNSGWWCERVIYTNVFDEYGKPVKAFGAVRDVTREKEVEQQFYEEITYRDAMHHATLSSVKLDLNHNIILDGDSQFNCVKQLISTASADKYFESTAESITDDIHRKEYRRVFSRDYLLNSYKNGNYYASCECPRVFDDNRIYWIKYAINLTQKPYGEEIFAFIYSTDITHEKVMQSIMDTIVKTDYEFLVVVDGVNNRATEYAVKDGTYLYSENSEFEQVTEKLIQDSVCSEDIERVLNECKIKSIVKNLQSSSVHKLNFSVHESNGEIRRKQLQFTRINDTRKTYLMARIDVTGVFIEQEKSKDKLQTALSLAEKANQAKSDFLSRMSHDIRTPMNAIIGMTSLAMDETDNAAAMVGYLTNITSSSQFLLGLINDILDMAKIESGKLELHPSRYEYSEFITSINTMILPLCLQKGITFTFEKRCPHITLMIDKIRFNQVFFNLLSNAVKFTPEGGRITFKLLSSAINANTLLCCDFSVHDNGIGMSREFQANLFKPFTQESTSVSAESSGTGLGLTIAKSIIDLMGGSINIKSNLGEGTEVTVHLDIPIVHNDENDDFCKQKIAGDHNLLVGKKILLVEDHPLNTAIAKKLLEKKGMIVHHAENGKIAVEMFSGSPVYYFDSVLMDIRMPVMGGLEATELIRALERDDAATVPIIAMTANAFDDDVDASLRSGMSAHLAKPIDPLLLYDTIAKNLKLRLEN
ncbi:MAG: PAS domain-containing protein [Oscillospiraceae bacterium]